MSAHPTMPLDTDSYLADTTHLGTTETGAYLLLLIAMWRSKDGWLPGDDRYLSHATRLTMDKWRKISVVIRALLQEHDGRVSQKRIRKERSQNPRQDSREDSGNIPKSLKNKEPDSKTTNPQETDSLFLSPSSESKVKEGRKLKGRILPNDWQITDEERLYGRTVAKLTDAEIDAAAEKMRRWALTNAHRSVARKTNWDMTFRNWMDSDAERKSKPTNGGFRGTDRTGSHPTSGGSGFATFAIARARAASDEGS